MFRLNDFKRITLADAAELAPRLAESPHNTCEGSFANLYVWGYPCGTVHQRYNGHDYFVFTSDDEIIFRESADPSENPSADELAEVSAAMREAGSKGTLYQVRNAYCEQHPDLQKYFKIEPLPDEFDEYIYEVQALIDLKGEKLRKKRNLIKQFLRDFPDAEAVEITQGKILDDCLALSEEWRRHQEEPELPHLKDEAEALSHLPDGFHEMGFQGVAAYTGGRVAAYAIYARINGDTFTESFEKSLPGCKGAAQFINHEMAKRLSGQCTYINREQDLGFEGLRQAKLSYDPILIMKANRLVPLS